MRRQGAAVDLGAAAGPADALRDVEDDAREAVLVDEDLLGVGHLAQLGDVGEVVGEVALEGAAEEGGTFVVGHFACVWDDVGACLLSKQGCEDVCTLFRGRACVRVEGSFFARFEGGRLEGLLGERGDKNSGG